MTFHLSRVSHDGLEELETSSFARIVAKVSFMLLFLFYPLLWGCTL